ncbi:serine hydrolase domain-containing protein [Amycolatopsis sp. A133]|uniref:serine hydrolase domain-containing protein n=1 Tax=Amycolatopsis sp. A133 TaxID=3064472 RepID=UPI0028000773|nr:serine hydrolase domain-containing protein [Amycolatopsis sp. A133]MDQ7803260.1 serine hydrolase domain-containing protein [Amycolatopsis sp. A133]
MRKSLPGRRIVAVGTLVALLAATTAAPALAATADPVQRGLDVLTAQDGVPGAEAVLQDGHRTRVVRSGTADLATGKPFPRNGSYRAGSVTKTFVATVVLQLVAEGRVRLDAPVERYLPGLLPDRRITVRQLLQHTSGLYNYTDEFDRTDPEALRHRGAEPAELVAMALKHPALFPPGTSWSYSNTNYIVAGMIAEKVTGHALTDEIARRITRPLGLHDTYLPRRGDERLPAPHAIGYVPGNGKLVDFSDFDATIAWAAGGLVSTPADLNRFYGALLNGRLLRPAELAEMQRTVPADLGVPGAGYGLGLGRLPVSCGQFWGHQGGIIGFTNLAGVGPHDRRAAVVLNQNPPPAGVNRHLYDVTEAAVCS